MGRLQLVAAALVLSASSYAWAAPPEAVLGRSVPKPAPGAAAAPVAPGRAPDRLPAAGRFGSVLEGIKPEGRAATRGVTEVRVYEDASPAVVLVVTDEGLGSGVLVSADGKIVTNLHVVGAHDRVGVIFKPRTEGADIDDADIRVVKVVRRDEVADLALLQISELPAGVKPLAIAGPDAVKIGSDVHAIGHPTGETWTYTRGIVSQIRQNYEWTAEDRLPHKATVIQTQTPINPGNSGGPLLDDALEVVGINSFTGEGEGLNFAVSAADVRAFLARAGDREADPVLKAKLACEPKSLSETKLRKPRGMEYLVDSDCDGKGDYLMDVPDKQSEAILYMMDENGDGKIDAVIADDDRDDNFDIGLYDTDGNGKFDMRGDFRNGETEPYRMEKIKEE